ncbi:MAG: hypothetical protein M5R36_26570 [Deltaproteobacteria bacterium]|nr:hypothetical protein [Deltaproteobacteria bacterium]
MIPRVAWYTTRRMNSRFLIFPAVVLLIASVGGCDCNPDRECEKNTLDVTVAGLVTFDGELTGPIAISLCEDKTTRCSDDGSLSESSPGACRETVTIDAPGEFELSGTLRWADDNRPRIALHVHTDQDGDGRHCDSEDDAGEILNLPAEDIDTVEVNLVAGGDCSLAL